MDPSFTHGFSSGTHEVRLVVTDRLGLSALDRRKIVVLDGTSLPPEVFAQATPVAGEAPLTVTLFADAGDLDGHVGEVRWEFSDGQVGAGAQVEHTFSAPGLYLATAIVIDDDGLEGRATLELQATGGGDVPPVILSRPTTTALVGDAWTYDGDGLPVARGDRPMVWSLGKPLDGEPYGVPPGAIVDAQTGRITWTPTAPGVFPVVLVVENPAGITAQQFEVVVDGQLPTQGPSSGGCGCRGGDAPSSMLALIWLGGFRVLRRGCGSPAPRPR